MSFLDVVEGDVRMTLEELIQRLENENPMQVVPVGFGHPHSYRGYYAETAIAGTENPDSITQKIFRDELAFKKVKNVTVAQMLADAKSAVNETFTGWKGGEFTMRPSTDVWVVEEQGECGEGIGTMLLDYMFGSFR